MQFDLQFIPLIFRVSELGLGWQRVAPPPIDPIEFNTPKLAVGPLAFTDDLTRRLFASFQESFPGILLVHFLRAHKRD